MVELRLYAGNRFMTIGDFKGINYINNYFVFFRMVFFIVFFRISRSYGDGEKVILRKNF